MRRGHYSTIFSGKPRPAFTLVELLVVIAIIAILVALVASALIQVVVRQQNAKSEQVVNKVAALLDQQWKAVIDQAREEADSGKIPPGVYTLAGGDRARAKVIWIKLRLMQEFPMTYAEARQPFPTNNYINFNDLPPRDSYVQALAGKTSKNPLSEAGACLLLILSVSRRGMDVPIDTLGSDILVDTDGDGVKEIVDGWGTALGFYRFPTGSEELDSTANLTGAAATNRDPVDPQGLLTGDWPNWPSNPNNWWVNFHPVFEGICHTVSNAAGTGPQARYLAPVVVSAGRDKKFGLKNYLDPNLGIIQMAPDGSGADTDNIYSFRRTKD